MVGQSHGGMVSPGQTLALRGLVFLFHIVLRVDGSLFCRMVLPPMVLLTDDYLLFHTQMLVVEVRKLILSAEVEESDGDHSCYPTAVVEGVGSRSEAVAGLLGN